MKKILIAIDMQNDFVSGALGSPAAEAIVQSVVREIESDAYDAVFATMDTHTDEYADTLEGKLLPVPHCIKDTKGWQIEKRVSEALKKRNAVIIEKPTFGSEKLKEEVKKLNPDEIVLVGLCTDICVCSNAILLRAALPDTPIHVVKDACAASAEAKQQEAFDIMESCQITAI